MSAARYISEISRLKEANKVGRKRRRGRMFENPDYISTGIAIWLFLMVIAMALVLWGD